ncbi:MAG: sulfurtransferase [Pseudomonadota bacterium]
MTDISLPPLVQIDWVAARLSEMKIQFIDGSWFLEDGTASARRHFQNERLPGAVFFDIDEISDPKTHLPHMLPTDATFNRKVSDLGIRCEDPIVVYDQAGLFSAPRVWFSLKAFGWRKVAVLNGGLPAWREAGLPLETEVPPSQQLDPEKVTRLSEMKVPGLSDQAIVSREEVLAIVNLPNDAQSETQILDARPNGRFAGRDPEPRKGLRSGAMPGALNIPAGELIENGKLKPTNELECLFKEAGVRADTQKIFTCGSGITAAIIALAMETIGWRGGKLYDGSWAEWGDKAYKNVHPVVSA